MYNDMHSFRSGKVGKSGLCLVEFSCRESKEVAGGADVVPGSGIVEETRSVDSILDLYLSLRWILLLPTIRTRHTMTAQIVAQPTISFLRIFEGYCSHVKCYGGVAHQLVIPSQMFSNCYWALTESSTHQRDPLSSCYIVHYLAWSTLVSY